MPRKNRVVLSVSGVLALAALILMSAPTADNYAAGQTADDVIFEKYSAWGQCPSNISCEQRVILHASGRVSFAGSFEGERQIDQENMEKIIFIIQSSGLMEKNCEPSTVLDYSAHYTIRFNGREKSIQFPGCHEDLLAIDKYLPIPNGEIE